MPPPRLKLESELLTAYFELFVNRRAYTLQAVTGEGKEKNCYYYRPKDDRYLCLETLRNHLLGKTTEDCMRLIQPRSGRSGLRSMPIIGMPLPIC